MTRLVWGQKGHRKHEFGLDRGVYYPQTGSGLPWNGLLAVKTLPIDVTASETYIDGKKLYKRELKDSFAGTIEAYTYPAELDSVFGFSYRTAVGNDVGEITHKIHLVYNALASPSQKNMQTFDEDPETVVFSWDFFTMPIAIPGMTSTAHIVIDTSIAYGSAIQDLENRLYGSPDFEPSLPPIQEIVELFEDHSVLVITDHGDGTWSAEGPDNVVYMIDTDLFQINWPSAIYLDSETYQVSTL